jgi:folate-binding protein YgfZ
VNGSALIETFRSTGAALGGEPERVLTFGDVPAEYRAGVEGAAIFDATDREALEITGADAAVFLHRLLSNDVRKLEMGRSQRNLLLSAKGKVLFDFDLARDDRGAEARFVISTPPGRAKALAAALDMYLFAEKVKIADVTATHAPIDITGPRADEVVRKVIATSLPEETRAFVHADWNGPLTITRQSVAGSAGLRLDAGPARAAELWRALVEAGAHPAGRIAHDSLRAEALSAEPLVDIDENVYPQEARLENAFSLEKGCYIGQEVVAKIDTYGGLNKRMVALRVSHDDPVARGTRLFRLDEGEWRDLGVVTTWAYSFALDAGLVLAYVKRRHQKPGTEFRVGEGPATAVIVPSPVRTGVIVPTGEFE